MVEWRNAGIKTYIYSSGSREAQRLFFEHSQAGDLRPFLCGFFDTSSGPKTEAASYTNIQHTLGVDDAEQVGPVRDGIIDGGVDQGGECCWLINRPMQMVLRTKRPLLNARPASAVCH